MFITDTSIHIPFPLVLSYGTHTAPTTHHTTPHHTPTTFQLKDITAEVLPFLTSASSNKKKKKKSPLGIGDLFVLHAETDIGPFVLASFHGDTQVRACPFKRFPITISLYAIATSLRAIHSPCDLRLTNLRPHLHTQCHLRPNTYRCPHLPNQHTHSAFVACPTRSCPGPVHHPYADGAV